jgi:hypothetical protein
MRGRYDVVEKDQATVFETRRAAMDSGSERLLPGHTLTALIAPMDGGWVISLPMRSDVGLLPTRYVRNTNATGRIPGEEV